MESPDHPPARPARPRLWARRGLQVLTVLVVAALLYARWRPRPASLPLAASIDGPAPARAARVLVFLHGIGGSLSRAAPMVAMLREAGLPADVSIVLLEGPFSNGLGHSWGHTAEEQATSRVRLRARLRELLGEGGPAPARVVIAGFSQGAGVAIDTAVEEQRIGAVASLSPCLMWLRGELPRRAGLRILLAHGTHDERCPVNESRSLARVLAAAHRPAQYIEFDGGHTVPPEVVRALVTFNMTR